MRKVQHLTSGSWTVRTNFHPHPERTRKEADAFFPLGPPGTLFVTGVVCLHTCAHVYAQWHMCENYSFFFFSLNHINPSSQVGDPVGKITGAFITCRGGISSYNDSLVIWHHFPPHIHSERQVFKEDAQYPRSLIAVFKAHSWHSKTSCRTRDFLAPELLPFSLLLGAASWWDVESK